MSDVVVGEVVDYVLCGIEVGIVWVVVVVWIVCEVGEVVVDVVGVYV